MALLTTLSLLALGMGSPASVSDFGAVGDGVTDDTAAFARALTECRGELYVPPGRYMLSGISLPESTWLHGAGRATVLLQTDPQTPVVTLGNGCRLSDLRIDGNGLEGGFGLAVVKAANVSDLTIEDVAIADSGLSAIFLDHGDDAVIRGCRLERVFRAVSIVFSSRVKVLDNTVTDCAEHGIVFWGNWQWESQLCRDLIIEGNYCRDAGGGPIWGAGGVRVVASGNVVDGAEDVGIDFEWCADSVMCGNTVTRCKNAGLSLFYACRDIAIAGNTVVVPDREDGERIGIWLTDPNRGEYADDWGHRAVAISGNTVRAEGEERRGIAIGVDSEGVRLTGNVLTNAALSDLGKGTVSD